MHRVVLPRGSDRRPPKLANFSLEFLGHCLQPVPDRGVLATSRKLSVALGEFAQIGNIVHREGPSYAFVRTQSVPVGSEIL